MALGVGGEAQDVACEGGERLTSAGGGDLTANALEERRAERAFQGADMLAGSGLGHVHGVRAASEGAVLEHRDEDA